VNYIIQEGLSKGEDGDYLLIKVDYCSYCLPDMSIISKENETCFIILAGGQDNHYINNNVNNTCKIIVDKTPIWRRYGLGTNESLYFEMKDGVVYNVSVIY